MGPCGCVRLIWLEIDGIVRVTMLLMWAIKCELVCGVFGGECEPFNFAAIERRRMTCMACGKSFVCVGLCVNRFSGEMCDCSDLYVSTQEFCVNVGCPVDSTIKIP